MKFLFEHNSQLYSLDLARNGQTASLVFNDQPRTVEILRTGESQVDFRLSTSPANGAPVSAAISRNGRQHWVTVNGQTFRLTLTSHAARRGAGAQHADGALTAPMPGQIRAVQASAGERVAKGQTLTVIEAMKMELKISAPFDGVVKTVVVSSGQIVEKDQLLVELERNV